MYIRLTYQSGQRYSEHFSEFVVKISRNATNRIVVSFSETGIGQGYSSWSLPSDKAQQLAHAILMACAGDVKPLEFAVQERPAKKAIAA